MLSNPAKYRREAPLPQDEIVERPTTAKDLGDLVYSTAWLMSRDQIFEKKHKELATKIVKSNIEANMDIKKAVNLTLRRMERNPSKYAQNTPV